MLDHQDVDEFLRRVALRTWDVFRSDPLLYVVSTILVVVFGVLTLGLLAGPLYGGYVDLVRRQMRGERVSVHDLAYGLQSALPFMVTAILVAVAVLAGLALVVLPGLLVFVFSIFAFHFMVYENAMPVRALSQSYYLVKNNFLPVLVLVVCLSVPSVLSASLPLMLLLCGPLWVIALTVAFEELIGARDDVAPATAATPEPA